jgi:hydroxymethylglutaryl-CoA lyase
MLQVQSILNPKSTVTKTIHLVECPRDAMQGWKHFIPTEQKIDYINSLLQVGFDTIDFGSFVSSKAIPQMADTKLVLEGLDLSNTRSRLLAIVANLRGAEEAVGYDKIDYLGFPFSVSETFQKRNANSGMAEAMELVKKIQHLCISSSKQLVVYISMGFGNPYGDPWSEEIVFEWGERIANEGITIISLADTVGLAKPEQIRTMVAFLSATLPEISLGVHLHSRSEGWKEKIDNAFFAGADRFDGALKGIGGCPMANDELVGNMQMEKLLGYFAEKNLLHNINEEALVRSLQMANEIFV